MFWKIFTVISGRNHKVQLYYVTVYPFLAYGHIVWGST